jgi:hypothetical protein
MRLLASEALTGFGFIALSCYHQARQGADVAELLTHHFVGERFVGLESIFLRRRGPGFSNDSGVKFG